MNGEIQNWFKDTLTAHPEICGRVIEIGAKDICGSARRWFTVDDGTQRTPTARFPEYIGIDLVEGGLVDMILNAHSLTRKFGQRAFDVVVSTSQLEHDDDPFWTVWEVALVLKIGGWLMLTVPNWNGEPPHDYVDYWRFLKDGVRVLVERTGMEVVELRDDLSVHDVMCLARRVK